MEQRYVYVFSSGLPIRAGIKSAGNGTACRESMDAAERDLDFIPHADIFATSPADSIDYAVMEHTADGAVVSLDCDWSDIGALSALWEAGSKDE